MWRRSGRGRTFGSRVVVALGIGALLAIVVLRMRRRAAEEETSGEPRGTTTERFGEERDRQAQRNVGTTEAVEEPPSVEVSAIEEDEDAPMVEGDTTEAIQGEEPSGEDIRSIIRESVSRSGAGSRQEVPQTESTTPKQSRRAGDEELPIEDYDSLNVKQISERLAELSDEEVEQLRRYEAANKNRSTLLRRLDERL